MSNEILITLETIKGMIERRKIAGMKKLFAEEDRKEQIDRIFYYYVEDGKYWRKKVAETEIVYYDQEYLVVKSMRGFTSWNGETYHAVWVFGIDGDQLWMHRLPWTEDFETKGFKWTRGFVRRRMGFEKSIEEVQEFKINEIVRLQGDLAVTKFHTIESHRDQECIMALRNAVWDFEYEKRRTKEEVGQFMTWFTSDFGKRYTEMLKHTRQINIRTGNHVIVVEKGVCMDRRWDVGSVIIPEPTNVFVIHDEHENRVIRLDAGLYQFQLLTRHITDRR